MLLGKRVEGSSCYAKHCILALKRKLLSGHSICQSSSSLRKAIPFSFFFFFSFSVCCGGQPPDWYMGAPWHVLWHPVRKGGEWKGVMWKLIQTCQCTSPALAATGGSPGACHKIGKWRYRLESRACQYRATKVGPSPRRSIARCPICTLRWVRWHLNFSQSRWV